MAEEFDLNAALQNLIRVGPTEEEKKRAASQAFARMGLGILSGNQPSSTPRNALGVLAQGGIAGLDTYQGVLAAQRQERADSAANAVRAMQIRKLKADLDLQNSLTGVGASPNMADPDKLDAMAFRLAAAGHPGAATLTSAAERQRTARENRATVDSFKSAPGILGAGVTTDSPQGRALLSNLTGDREFDSAVLEAQNEALNANPKMVPQTLKAARQGLFGVLSSSPYVGSSAQSLQNQLDTSKGIPAQTWLQQFDKLQGLHSTGVNQAAARQDTADLRRELAGQSDRTRREIADMNAALRTGGQDDRNAQRTFTQERQLSENYNALAKPFRTVVPQFQAAAQYVAEGKYDSSGDRALVFQFAKTLDPNDRVGMHDLRDIKKLGNVPERITKAVESLAVGQQLPDRVRQEMFAVMRSRFEGMNEQQQQIEDEYMERARRYMLNPSNVVLPYAVRRDAQVPGGATPAVIDFSKLPRGR